MLEVITPAVTHDLTVLDTLKSELMVTGTADDAYLDSLIAQVSAACARHCSRTGWGRETLRQTERPAKSLDCIILARDLAPSITSVIEDGTTLAVTDYELDGSLLYRLFADRRTSWTGSKIVVTYSAGFLTLTDLPYDLERAALEWLKACYANRGNNPLVRSQSAQDVGSVSYHDPRAGLEAMPPQTAGYLAPWKLQAP